MCIEAKINEHCSMQIKKFDIVKYLIEILAFFFFGPDI